MIMKLLIPIVVSVLICCNAEDYSPKAIQLLEAILNETRATREESFQRSIAQENAINDLVDRVAAIYNELEAQHRQSQHWYTQPNVFVSFASCEDIKTMSPSAPSGYYNITNYGTTQCVYCDMEKSHQYLCGTEPLFCGSAGWTRVAYLDMSDSSQQCPTELREYDEGGVRACGRQTSSGGSCNSVTFCTNGISYSQVCGRVKGYQYASPDALWRSNRNIESYYVDGISITHGSPRQHIWTLMGGYSQDGPHTRSTCPCNTGNTVTVPSSIGSDYFCESGNPSSSWSHRFYSDDPLWDGEECGGIESPCCNVTGIPWFHKTFKSPTTNNIELRVCADQSTYDEDVSVSLYEIYVK